MFRAVVPKALAGKRLDHVLEALLEGVSRSQAQKLVRKGSVLVDGRRVVRSNGVLQRGANLEVEIVESPPTIPILYEDRHLLVVHKPAGLLTHDADRADGPSVASLLHVSHGPLALGRGDDRPGVVHRLDRATSGVLVLARHDDALQQLQDQFRARTVEKRYLAIVCGVPDTRAFTVDEPLGPVPRKPDRQCVDTDRGKPARTDIDVLETFESHAFAACDIATGRRHQIRVHLAHAGYPVLGDALYGTKKQRVVPGVQPPEIALHAAHLGFDHPVTGERMAFDAPLPPSFERVLAALRQR